MYKKDVLAHFGRASEIAKALGISAAAISQWGDVIPEKNAYRLQEITHKKLKVDKELYRPSA